MSGQRKQGYTRITHETLAKYRAYAGYDFRRLKIDLQIYRIDGCMMELLLTSARDADCLDLRLPFIKFEVLPAVWPRRIKHMVLDWFPASPGLLEAAAGSVVNFEMRLPSAFPVMVFDPEAPLVWSRLRYLKLSSTDAMSELLQNPPIMPNLEQFWIKSSWAPSLYHDELADASPIPRVEQGVDKCWAGKLKVFVLDYSDATVDLEVLYPLVRILAINNGDNLQHLDLKLRWRDPVGQSIIGQEYTWDDLPNWLGRADFVSPARPANTFKNLHSLRLDSLVLDAETSRLVLEASLLDEKLRTLDIVFPTLLDPEEWESACIRRIDDFSWLTGAGSISSMGVFGFRFVKSLHPDNVFPLTKFLASFPNLEELEISPKMYRTGSPGWLHITCDMAELCAVLDEVMRATKLKRLYCGDLDEIWLTKLADEARKHSIKVIPGPRLREWPMPVL